MSLIEPECLRRFAVEIDLALQKAGDVNGEIFTNYELNKTKMQVFVAMTPQDFIETIFDPYGRRTHLDYQLFEFTISSNWMSSFWAQQGVSLVAKLFAKWEFERNGAAVKARTT
ncbi:MAG: hypothetical protein ACR2QF_04165 [Geminicoccaceae bacterium]